MNLERLVPAAKKVKTLFKRSRLVKRNWEVEIPDVPDQVQKEFIDSILYGTADFEYEGNHQNVLLCAQPKSASLYLARLVSLALDYKLHWIGLDGASGDIYLPRIIAAKFADKDTISHCHAPANKYTLKVIKNLNLTPLVLYRNLPDSLVSRRDMLVKDAYAPEMLSPNLIRKFLNYDKERQMDMIIDLYALRYMNFYTSWKDLAKNNKVLNITFIRYKEIISGQISMLKKLAYNLGQKIDTEKARKTISDLQEVGGVNFNKGKMGRGEEALSETQKKRIISLAKKYNCYNEDYIGF
jgi:hypothetical protein